MADNTRNDIQLIDLGLPSGTLWADRNVGADSPEGYGDYFRFGETTSFTEKSPSYKYEDINYNILYMDAKDVNKDLKIKYNVNEYPTILFFKNKRLVNKYVLELDNINYNDIKNIIDYSNGENND